MATPIEHLPTELLSKILKNVDAGSNTLKNVSLTCQLLRNLAQPLIFRNVHLTCFKKDVSRQSARIDFYSSDAIAPFVHNFSVSGDASEVVQPNHPNPLAKIFDALPRFTNIQSLSCFGVNFTPFALHQVSTLSSLNHLSAVGSIAPPKTDSLPMLRLRSFTYTGLVPHDWLTLLDPNHLQVLHIPLTVASCSFLLANKDSSLCPFPSLHAVDWFVDWVTLPALPILLSTTPMLRSIKLFPSYSNLAQYKRIMEELERPAACPVPILEEYRGPPKLLPVVLGREMRFPSTNLRRLCLESVSEAGDPLGDFISSLKSCHPHQLRGVTHLRISLLESVDLKSLARLQDMFPVLQEFYLHASERFNPSARIHSVDLTDLSNLPFPNTLVSLSIQWTSRRDAEAVPDLVAAKDSLLPRFPYLRRLWLFDLSKVALLWSRAGLRAEERCTLHTGSQFAAWKMREEVFPEHSILRL